MGTIVLSQCDTELPTPKSIISTQTDFRKAKKYSERIFVCERKKERKKGEKWTLVYLVLSAGI